MNFNLPPASEYFLQVSQEIEGELSFFMLEYIRKFQPEDYEKMFEKYPASIEKLIDRGQEAEARDAVTRMHSDWQRLIKEISYPLTSGDQKKIHAMQRNLNIDKYTYRNILMQQAGKQSSAGMKKYEIALAINGLQLYSEGKLQVTAWDEVANG